MNAPRQRTISDGRGKGWFFVSAALSAALVFLGCAGQRQVYMQPVSMQALDFYPYQVKGFENTYPHRSIIILAPRDARDFKDAAGVGHEPYDGNVAIGVVLDQTGKIDQRLYSTPLAPLVQRAILQSAQEAGMNASGSNQPLKAVLQAHSADYVLASKITRFWVNKHRGPDTQAGPSWFTAADVSLEVAIYKPPFNVPFWQGNSTATYDDPPLPVAGMNPEDDTEIYDQPGQVLSVALTRAAAGIFKRNSLHSLMLEDITAAHR